MINSVGSPFMFPLWLSDNKWSHVSCFVVYMNRHGDNAKPIL